MEQPRVRRPRNWKAIGVGAAVAAVLLTYLVGRLQGQAGLAAARRQADVLTTTARIMAARGWLYRAAIDLTDSNFGSAQSDVDKASLALQKVEAATAGPPADRLKSAQQSVAGLNVQVAGDVRSQRAGVLAAADAVGALLPPEVANVAVR